MPLVSPRTHPLTACQAFANVYVDQTANTVEFGARIYSTQEQAMERALSHPIRPSLTYVGPIQIGTQVSDTFIEDGIAASQARHAELTRLHAEREAGENQQLHYQNDGIDSAHPTDGSGSTRPAFRLERGHL